MLWKTLFEFCQQINLDIKILVTRLGLKKFVREERAQYLKETFIVT
jgi:hypothetical protein